MRGRRERRREEETGSSNQGDEGGGMGAAMSVVKGSPARAKWLCYKELGSGWG